MHRANELLVAFKSGKVPIAYYNTACYFALAHKPDIAFVYLDKLLADGFSNTQMLQEDADLLSLHDNSLWQKTIAQSEKNDSMNKEKRALFFNQKSFWDSKFFSTPYRTNISDEEKIAGLSKLWSEVKYNFVNFDLIPGLDIDSLYFAYLPRVTHTASTLEYYKLLIAMCAQLHDGHTNVYVPDSLYSELYARPLLRSRLIEDKVFITDVYAEALRKMGILPGLEVVTVNGLPVKQYAARYVIPYESSSTPQDRLVRGFDYALFAGSLHEVIHLTLRDENGHSKAYTIHRVSPAERNKSTRLPAFVFKMLKGNVAYVALNSFGTDTAAKAFAAQYNEISKADAIIFDVRNNGGGSTSVGWNILSYLIDKALPVHAWYTRQYTSTYRAWGRTQQAIGGQDKLSPNGKHFYNKPVIVLTSARTFSAADDFVAAFRSMHRGLVVGEATGGSTGQPLMIRLPGNGVARICTKRDQLANAEDFVGKGVIPDIPVVPTISDFRKGIDTVLQAALRALGGKNASGTLSARAKPAAP